MSDTEGVRCFRCIFLHRQDIGYSNWTVTGQEARCLFGLTSFSEEYGEAKDNPSIRKGYERFAEFCPHHIEGSGLYSDCDGEEQHQEIYSWIKQYVKGAEDKPDMSDSDWKEVRDKRFGD